MTRIKRKYRISKSTFRKVWRIGDDIDKNKKKSEEKKWSERVKCWQRPDGVSHKRNPWCALVVKHKTDERRTDGKGHNGPHSTEFTRRRLNVVITIPENLRCPLLRVTMFDRVRGWERSVWFDRKNILAGILRSIVSIGFLFRDFVLFGEFIASKLARLGTVFWRHCFPRWKWNSITDIVRSQKSTNLTRSSI